MPTNLQRLSSCMSNIVAALECPICLETIPAPAHQCVNGHLICFKCRIKTEKCPVCRIKLSRGRSLLADQVYNSLIDAFDLRNQEESKRRKILKQKLFGHKNGSTKNKIPDVKFSIINSPASKFLNKIMKTGKCSSAENLSMTSSTEKISKLLLTPQDDLHLGLKSKSLSSNEIFEIDAQHFTRTPSILSSRPGSGLLDVQSLTYSKKSASCHGSADDFHKKLMAEIKNKELLLREKENCCCPCDPTCENEMTPSTLMKHIQEYHEGPVLHFLKPRVELLLPLPYPNTTVLTVTSYNTVFIIKILDYSCKSDNNYLWIWSLNSDKNFMANVTIQEEKLIITSECSVMPIQSVGWQKIVNENLGFLINFQENGMKLQIEILPHNY